MASSGPALSLVNADTHQEKQSRKRRYSRKYLINKINYFNFQRQPLIAQLAHAGSGDEFTRPVYPDPCRRHHLFCTWPQPFEELPDGLEAYRLDKVLIPDGSRLFAFAPQQCQLSPKGLRFSLPDSCEDGNRRRFKRHTVSGIKASIDNGRRQWKGRLINFNAESFLISGSGLIGGAGVEAQPVSGNTVTLRLLNGRHICYTGLCRIVPHTNGAAGEGLVLAPFNEPVRCLAPKRYRCERYRPDLRPDVTLNHPLLRQQLVLRAFDLSGGGFSVHEPVNGSALLPGMRIRNLQLRFQDCPSIRCEVLVVYRNRENSSDTGTPKVRCGLVITDISPEDHTQLLAYLTHARSQRTYVCKPVDMDALWEFFFETGFIYPEKYAGFSSKIEKIKATYERLYLNPSNISRHFIYQEDGTILGHAAGIRAYEDSWMIHHLAANTAACPVAGLAVLKQVGHFLMAASNLASSHMKYILNYYQAGKKFSRRLWGGVTRRMDNPQNCCQYVFTYLRIRKMAAEQRIPQQCYTLNPCQRQDLRALQRAYRSVHGDLMLAALDLVPERLGDSTLVYEYQRMRLRRHRWLFTIKKGRRLEAVCMVIQTEEGLNMSDLINNIQILIMPDSELPAAALQQILQILAEPFDQEEIAVMLYPNEYTQNQCLQGERQYTLWVLDTSTSDAYFKYINRITRFT